MSIKMWLGIIVFTAIVGWNWSTWCGLWSAWGLIEHTLHGSWNCGFRVHICSLAPRFLLIFHGLFLGCQKLNSSSFQDQSFWYWGEFFKIWAKLKLLFQFCLSGIMSSNGKLINLTIMCHFFGHNYLPLGLRMTFLYNFSLPHKLNQDPNICIFILQFLS